MEPMTVVRRSPLVEELDVCLSPTSAFQLLKDEPLCYFLDSGMDPKKLGRYSFLGCRPFLLLKTRGNEVAISTNNEVRRFRDDPFGILRDLLNRYEMQPWGSAPIAKARRNSGPSTAAASPAS